MKKKLPRLASDAEAEAFVDSADLTQYDLSKMQEVRFEFGPKTERLNMRMPKPLLDAVKARARAAPSASVIPLSGRFNPKEAVGMGLLYGCP